MRCCDDCSILDFDADSAPFGSGGPAGCVTAGRLAYADPNLKVMLIEGEYSLVSML